MSFISKKPIVIKIGTGVITSQSGLIDTRLMKRLVEQVVVLHRAGQPVIIVSSGAVGSGRPLVRMLPKTDRVSSRQVLAAVGQVRLMSTYEKLFSPFHLPVAQVLATTNDFSDQTHRRNMIHCFRALLGHAVIPIVNENDVVAIEELMFTDNDALAGQVAKLVGAGSLVILTSVNGLVDAQGNTVSVVRSKADYQKHLRSEKSEFGRGGMQTKCAVALDLAKDGITTYIINGKKTNALIRTLTGDIDGTTFVPAGSKLLYYSRIKQNTATIPRK